MKKQYYFESGSSALLFSLLSEKEKSQTIFLPEFICNNLVERLKNNKIQIDYYKIKNDLTTDWIDLKKKIKKYQKEVIYILYVNYFGKINDRKKFIDIKSNFKNNNVIKLVEDNSHGHYLNIKKNLISKVDIFFSSPKKIFPQLYSGGILYRKKLREKSKYKNLLIQKVETFILIKLLIKNFLIKLNFYIILKKLFKNFYNQSNKNYKIQEIKKIDIYSYRKLKKINIKKELNSKIEKSELIKNKLKKFKYKEYFKFNNIDNLPWYYVCLTKNLRLKRQIQIFCEKEKIAFFNWPELPLKNKNKRTKHIYDRIICIPLK